jgi:hypothetical protein
VWTIVELGDGHVVTHLENFERHEEDTSLLGDSKGQRELVAHVELENETGPTCIGAMIIIYALNLPPHRCCGRSDRIDCTPHSSVVFAPLSVTLLPTPRPQPTSY